MKLSAAAKKRILALVVVLFILVVDQCLKIWVKTHMCLGESIEITSWARIVFVENKGMAFGLEFVGTLILCLFRIVAVGALIWAMMRVTRKPWVKTGFVKLLAMVLAGDAGNIIDNVFYGLIFTDQHFLEPSQLVALGQGSGNLFEGRVVDMFYFPIIDTCWPDWMPVVGGDHFVFFSPIFNFADSAITMGGILMVCCYYKTLNRLLSYKKEEEAQ